MKNTRVQLCVCFLCLVFPIYNAYGDDIDDSELVQIRSVVRAACDEFAVLGLLSPPDYTFQFADDQSKLYGMVSCSQTAIRMAITMHSPQSPGAPVPESPTERFSILRTPKSILNYSERLCNLTHSIDKKQSLPTSFMSIAPHSWYSIYGMPMTRFTEESPTYHRHRVEKRGVDLVLIATATDQSPAHNIEIVFDKDFLPKSYVGIDPKTGRTSFYGKYVWSISDGQILLEKSTHIYPGLGEKAVPEFVRSEAAELHETMTEQLFMASLPDGTKYAKYSKTKGHFDKKFLGSGKSQQELSLDYELNLVSQSLRYSREDGK